MAKVKSQGLHEELMNRKLTVVHPGARLLTCCLDLETSDLLDKIAISRFTRPHSVLDSIIDQFVCNYEDKVNFIQGEEPKTLVEQVRDFLFLPPERKFVTFQLRDKSFMKVMWMKDEYNLSRSQIIKYMIDKYLKENGYV